MKSRRILKNKKQNPFTPVEPIVKQPNETLETCSLEKYCTSYHSSTTMLTKIFIKIHSGSSINMTLTLTRFVLNLLQLASTFAVINILIVISFTYSICSNHLIYYILCIRSYRFQSNVFDQYCVKLLYPCTTFDNNILHLLTIHSFIIKKIKTYIARADRNFSRWKISRIQFREVKIAI